MNDESKSPLTDQISMLTAVILLAYAIARIVHTPELSLTVSLPGFYFVYSLSINTAISLLAAGLAATGMDWIIRSHPALEKRPTTEHWMLPTLTAFIIGAPLSILPNGLIWWLGFALGAILLILVFIAEYIVVDPIASNYALARAGLTALSYALFFILVISLRFANLRLFLLLPVLLVAAGLISLRILHLDGTDRWDFPWAIGIGIISTQLGAGLHYWPLSPIQYGLVLTGPLYALTMLSANITEGIPIRRASTTPSVILMLTWATAIFLK
jgi:Protein of unknown function (DUF5656)